LRSIVLPRARNARTLFRYACMHNACMRTRSYMSVYVHAYKHTHDDIYIHTHIHIYIYILYIHAYTCRDDELDRVIVPLATGVVGTIKACVPGVKTCKDALYKVPPRRHHSVSLVFLLQPPAPPRNETFKYSRTSFPTATLYTRFTCARFSARWRQSFPIVLPGI